MTFLAKASLIIGAFYVAGEMANASVMSNGAHAPGEVIFILNGAENPAEVQLGGKKHSSRKFMRLPDLSAILQTSSSKHLLQGSASSTIYRRLPTDAKIETAQVNKEHRKSFKFKPTKVSGRPKLPSIKFTSIRPALELYEEAPSLDFTDKSLKDGGF